jgi:P27 family predicted phage terminase small subunit
MAQVGRPPKPAEQKRRLGDPGRHGLPAANEVAALQPLRDDVPPDLGPAGAELWEAVSSAAAPWLAPSDKFTLHLLCELYDRRAEYKRCLTDYGTLIVRPGDGHLVANPAAQLLIQTEKQITEIAASLGLTPADRTRMGLAEVKAKNAFEELMAKRNQRG